VAKTDKYTHLMRYDRGMPEDDLPKKQFYAVSYKDDIPNDGTGSLIPYQKKPIIIRPENRLNHYIELILVPMAALLFIFTASVLGVKMMVGSNTASLPTVSIVNPFTNEVKTLNYGVQLALAQPNFFTETRDAFIDEAITFIEVDLNAMQLRYFKDGVLLKSISVKSKGKEGSWWQTPAGLYKIEAKKENYYSSFGYMYQPWSLTFQGNFFIHGWPKYADGKEVPEDFSGGCIRLTTEDAEELYKLVTVGTPVLVHEKESEDEDFIYEPKVPELDTENYLIADIKSSTVLASNNMESILPIASVTKLMTALIAAENINLDTSVSVKEQSFVQSLIPRLGDRSKVSLYSLLQLLLVESSNEAAEVISAQLGKDEFIKLMNDKALNLGMKDTKFADASGLSPENISSLRDLLLLSKYIYENRSFIFEVTVNQNLPTAYVSGEFGELVNFNKVEYLDNLIGGKVGETIAAGQTSVTLHRLKVKDQDRVLAIIILGSKNRNSDVNRLYAYAEEKFAR